MKRLLFIITIAGFALTVRGQSSAYHAFKVDIGAGYAIPSSGGGAKAGATFTVQPHYRLTDDFAVGLRIEGAALGYETAASGQASDVKISALLSYCATGEYYLMNSGFRPFVGAGAGLFTQSSLNVGSGTNSYFTPSSSKFGFFPEIGFEAGHFRMSADYDILGSNSGYFAVKIGFFLGGGKK